MVLGTLIITYGAMVVYDLKLLYPYAAGITVIIIRLLVLLAGPLKRKDRGEQPQLSASRRPKLLQDENVNHMKYYHSCR